MVESRQQVDTHLLFGLLSHMSRALSRNQEEVLTLGIPRSSTELTPPSCRHRRGAGYLESPYRFGKAAESRNAASARSPWERCTAPCTMSSTISGYGIRRTVAAMCVDTPAASYDLAGTEYTFYMESSMLPRIFTDAFILKVAERPTPKGTAHLARKGVYHRHRDASVRNPMANVPTLSGDIAAAAWRHTITARTRRPPWTPRSLRDISVIDAVVLLLHRQCRRRGSALWSALEREPRLRRDPQGLSPFLDRLAGVHSSNAGGPRRDCWAQADAKDGVFRRSGIAIVTTRSSPGPEDQSTVKSGSNQPYKLRPYDRLGANAIRPIRDAPEASSHRRITIRERWSRENRG